MELVLTLTAKNTSDAKTHIIGRLYCLQPDYVITEIICMYQSYEYSEFVIYLKRNETI
jgi:hypothetical protein